jgi:hypothetical protein
MSSSGDQSEEHPDSQQRRLIRVIRATIKMLGDYLAALLGWLGKYLTRLTWTHLVAIISILVLTILALVPTAGTEAGISWPVVLFAVIGTIAAAVLAVVPRSRYRSLFDKHFGWIPVTVGVVTYPLWYLTVNRLGITPASQFFEISAQVLPVILLAVIIDVGRSRYLKSYQLALPIFAVFLGESAALNILAFGEPGSGHHLNATAFDFSIVAASLVSTVTALMLAVLADLEENGRRRDAPPDQVILPEPSSGHATDVPERAENCGRQRSSTDTTNDP